jgi:Poly-beta-hydroxybutyrate polymerase (PhaC) N-terminus
LPAAIVKVLAPTVVGVPEITPVDGSRTNPGGSCPALRLVAELIQYTPTTKQMYERPTLIVPPPIGRFYFLDLAPGRSFAEYTWMQGGSRCR